MMDCSFLHDYVFVNIVTLVLIDPFACFLGNWSSLVGLNDFFLFVLFWQCTCINTTLLFLQPHGNASLWRTIVVCAVLN